jgi:hypothetical protein
MSQSVPGMQGLHVAQVLLFFSFAFDDIVYPCALVHWFVPVNTELDNVTSMWVVKPEYSGTSGSQRVVSVIHIDSHQENHPSLIFQY